MLELSQQIFSNRDILINKKKSSSLEELFSKNCNMSDKSSHNVNTAEQFLNDVFLRSEKSAAGCLAIEDPASSSVVH